MHRTSRSVFLLAGWTFAAFNFLGMAVGVLADLPPCNGEPCSTARIVHQAVLGNGTALSPPLFISVVWALLALAASQQGLRTQADLTVASTAVPRMELNLRVGQQGRGDVNASRSVAENCLAGWRQPFRIFQAGGIMGPQTTPAVPAQAATAGQEPQLLTPAQVAQLLGVAESDVMSSLQKGDLKGKQIGTQWRVTRAAVDQFLHS